MKVAIGFLLTVVLFFNTPAASVTKTWLSAGTGNASKWNRSTNWSPSGVPGSADDVVIPKHPANGSGFPVLDANASVQSIFIDDSASLTGGNNQTLTVSGSISGGGTLDAGPSPISVGGAFSITTFLGGTSVFTLNGTSAQSIAGYTFYNLTVNNPSGVTLSGDVTVTGILTLMSGVVTTGTNKISISSNVTTALAFGSGSVNGEIARILYKPSINSAALTYSFTDPNTAIVLVPGNPPPTNLPVSVRSYPGVQPPNQLGGVAINRYYTITPADTLAATLRLAYLDSELNGISENDLGVFRYQSGWGLQPGSAVDSVANFVELPGVSTWSNWTLGSTSNPLPIQLGRFTAAVSNNGRVTLDWMTLSELNNYGFEVQKSLLPPDYQTIPNSFVPGHGTTTEPQYYAYVDGTSAQGHWYYRLKQYDLDGTVHFTEGIQVDVLTGVEETPVPTVYALRQNYPNPFNPSTTIRFSLPATGHVLLNVFDLLGRNVGTLVNEVKTPGTYDIAFDASALSSGVYLYRLQSGGFIETRKLILQK